MYSILIIFILILSFRFIYSDGAWNTLPQNTGSALSGDQNFYDRTGFSLSRGEGYALEGKPTCFYQPGYPAFLGAIFYFFGHSYRAVIIIQIILAFITFSMFLYLAECLFKKYSFIPALLYLSNYMLLQFVNALMTETLALFLFMFSHFLLYQYLKVRKNYYLILLSISFGYLILVRPIFQLYPLCLLVSFAVYYIFSKDHAATPQILKSVVIFMAVSILVPLPWMIRNSNVFGSYKIGFIGGYSLYQGINPKYCGESIGWEKVDDDLNISSRIIGHPSDFGDLSCEPKYMARVDSILYSEALHIIEKRPTEVLPVMVMNVSRLLFFRPFSNQELSIQRNLLSFINFCSFICFIGGLLFLIFKKENKGAIIYSFSVLNLSVFLYYLAIHSLFAIEPRYGIYPTVQMYLFVPLFILMIRGKRMSPLILQEEGCKLIA